MDFICALEIGLGNKYINRMIILKLILREIDCENLLPYQLADRTVVSEQHLDNYWHMALSGRLQHMCRTVFRDQSLYKCRNCFHAVES